MKLPVSWYYTSNFLNYVASREQNIPQWRRFFSTWCSCMSFPTYLPAATRLQRPHENYWAGSGTGCKCFWPTWRHWGSQWLPGPPSSSILVWWQVGSPMWCAEWSARRRTVRTQRDGRQKPLERTNALPSLGYPLLRQDAHEAQDSSPIPSTSKSRLNSKESIKNTRPSLHAHKLNMLRPGPGSAW